MNLDWLQFSDHVLTTLHLLGLAAPNSPFWSAPSPRTLANVMYDLKAQPLSEITFEDLVVMVALEDIVRKMLRDAVRHGYDYLHFSVALSEAVRTFLQQPSPQPDGNPKVRWAAPYLSACAGQNQILPLDRACKALAVQYGAEHDPVARSLITRLRAP